MDANALRAIRKQLDNVPATDDCSPDRQYCFDLVEEIAISILDSQHSDFTPGMLQEYLLSYLYLRQLEYELIDFPDPGES